MHVCFGVEITPLRYSLIGCLASLIIYLAFLGGIRYKFPSHELKIDTATQTTTPTETKRVRREEVIETIGPEILDTNAIDPIPQGYADAELQTDLTTPCDKAVGTDESDGAVVQTLRGYANAELQTEGISTREEAVGAIDPEVVYSNAAMQTHSEYADSNFQTEDVDLATLYPGINTLVERETAVSSREKLAAGHEEELGRYASHLERLADTIAMKEDAVKKREIETYFAEKYVEAWMKNLVGEEEKLGRSRRELSDREFDLESRELRVEMREEDIGLREDDVQSREAVIRSKEVGMDVHNAWMANRELAVDDREIDLGFREAEVAIRGDYVEGQEEDLAIWRRDLQGREEDFDNRERDFQGREEDLANWQRSLEEQAEDLGTRERDLQGQGTDFDKRERDLQGREQDLANWQRSLEEQAKDLGTRGRDLQGREEDLVNWQRSLEEQAKDLGTRGRDLQGREEDLVNWQRSLEEQAKDLGTRERDLQGQGTDFDKRERDLQGREQDLANWQRNLEEQAEDFGTRGRDLQGREEDLVNWQRSLEEQAKDLGTRGRDLSEAQRVLEARQGELEKIEQGLREKDKRLSEEYANIGHHANDIKTREHNIRSLEVAMSEQKALSEQNTAKQEYLHTVETYLGGQREAIVGHEGRINEVTAQLEERNAVFEAQMTSLRGAVSDLQQRERSAQSSVERSESFVKERLKSVEEREAALAQKEALFQSRMAQQRQEIVDVVEWVKGERETLAQEKAQLDQQQSSWKSRTEDWETQRREELQQLAEARKRSWVSKVEWEEMQSLLEEGHIHPRDIQLKDAQSQTDATDEGLGPELEHRNATVVVEASEEWTLRAAPWRMSSAYDKGMLESQRVGRKEVWGGNAQEGTRSLNVTLQSDDVESLDSAPKLLLEKVAMREDASSSTEAIEVESTGAATRNAPLSVHESRVLMIGTSDKSAEYKVSDTKEEGSEVHVEKQRDGYEAEWFEREPKSAFTGTTPGRPEVLRSTQRSEPLSNEESPNARPSVPRDSEPSTLCGESEPEARTQASTPTIDVSQSVPRADQTESGVQSSQGRGNVIQHDPNVEQGGPMPKPTPPSGVIPLQRSRSGETQRPATAPIMKKGANKRSRASDACDEIPSTPRRAFKRHQPTHSEASGGEISSALRRAPPRNPPPPKQTSKRITDLNSARLTIDVINAQLKIYCEMDAETTTVEELNKVRAKRPARLKELWAAFNRYEERRRKAGQSKDQSEDNVPGPVASTSSPSIDDTQQRQGSTSPLTELGDSDPDPDGISTSEIGKSSTKLSEDGKARNGSRKPQKLPWKY